METNQQLFDDVNTALLEAGYTGITVIRGADGDSVMASKDGGAALFRLTSKTARPQHAPSREFADLRERLALHPIVASAFVSAAAAKR